MGKGTSGIMTIFSAIYVSGLLLFLLLFVYGAFSTLRLIIDSGYAVPYHGLMLIGIMGFLVGFSMLMPSVYHKMPWLFPCVKMLYINGIILCIAATILNTGYAVQNAARHKTFLIMMGVQIVICRILMCKYFGRNTNHIWGWR